MAATGLDFQAAGLVGISIGMTRLLTVPNAPAGGADVALVPLDALTSRPAAVRAGPGAEPSPARSSNLPRLIVHNVHNVHKAGIPQPKMHLGVVTQVDHRGGGSAVLQHQHCTVPPSGATPTAGGLAHRKIDALSRQSTHPRPPVPAHAAENPVLWRIGG